MAPASRVGNRSVAAHPHGAGGRQELGVIGPTAALGVQPGAAGGMRGRLGRAPLQETHADGAPRRGGPRRAGTGTPGPLRPRQVCDGADRRGPANSDGTARPPTRRRRHRPKRSPRPVAGGPPKSAFPSSVTAQNMPVAPRPLHRRPSPRMATDTCSIFGGFEPPGPIL
jgi:hypothetical protein